MPPCKRSVVKNYTILARDSEKTSQVERKRNVFTSDQRERLHKQGFSFFVKMWRKGYAFWVKLCFAQWREDLRLRSPFFLPFKNAFPGLPSFHSGYPAFLQKKMAERASPAMFFVLLLVLYSKALIIKYSFPYFYENIQEIKPDKKGSKWYFLSAKRY